MQSLSDLAKDVSSVRDHTIYGTVMRVRGGLIEVGGITGRLAIGWRCRVIARDQREIECEVVGFDGGRVLLMAFDPIQGVGDGCRALIDRESGVLYPSEAWLGRVIDPLGRAVDGKGPLKLGEQACSLYASPPAAHDRRRVGHKLDLGVRALNTFVTCCQGQRLGIFAGSGVGKSTLLAMLARYTASDVTVIGLVGERGRELQEFIEDDLGPEGMARSVVVVATSDQSPLMRRQAAYVTLTVCEFFRNRGQQVLCLIDSITRFAMAQREIGLSAGEPPTSKGYPPTVFAELPRLLERAGPGEKRDGSGDITGLFTVLVDGDDLNEPIADAVRGILDGHIVMERSISERGRYPAINVLRSISRTMPRCNTPAETALIRRAVQLMSTYDDMAEMIRLGAYKQGSNQEVDEAIHFHGPLEDFLAQRKEMPDTLGSGFAQLANILGMPAP